MARYLHVHTSNTAFEARGSWQKQRGCCGVYVTFPIRSFEVNGRGDQGWQAYAGLGILVYFVLTFGAWLPYRMRRTFKQRKDLHRECSFLGTAEGLRFASEGVDRTKPW